MWLLFFAGLSASRSIFVLLPFRSLRSRYRVLKKVRSEACSSRQEARARRGSPPCSSRRRPEGGRKGNMNSCAKTESFLLSPLDDVFFLVRRPPSLVPLCVVHPPPARLCLSCVDSACSSVSFVLPVHPSVRPSVSSARSFARSVGDAQTAFRLSWRRWRHLPRPLPSVAGSPPAFPAFFSICSVRFLSRQIYCGRSGAPNVLKQSQSPEGVLLLLL